MNKDYQPADIEKIAQTAWNDNTSSKVNFSDSTNKYLSLIHISEPTRPR